VELTPQRAAGKLAVSRLDGWQARHRGPGVKEEKEDQERLGGMARGEAGVFYLHASDITLPYLTNVSASWMFTA
jgi:hypothetical protein